MTEAEVRDYFKRRLNCSFYFSVFRKVRWEGRRAAQDWLVLFPTGVSWWVELKATGEKPEPHQTREHDRFRLCGQNVIVLDSKESIDEWLTYAHAGKPKTVSTSGD